MMVKFRTGNSFAATAAYVLGATKEQKPTILTYAGIELDRSDAININRGLLSRKAKRKVAKYIGKSFDVQASGHVLGKPVRHYMMTFPSADTDKLMDNNRLLQIIKDYMSSIGITNTQYLVVRHGNTNNPHVHIVFNPIDNDFKVISESKQFRKNEKLCKEITQKYGLTFSDPRKYEVQNPKRLPKYDLYKAFTRTVIEDALKTSTDVKSFQDKLDVRGVQMIVHKIDQKPIGLSFRLKIKNKEWYFKATQLSRTMTIKNIIRCFEANRLRAKEDDKQKSLKSLKRKM